MRCSSSAISSGYDVSSSWVPKESGATLPLRRLLRGIEPSACCWLLKRKSVASRAVALSPSAIRPVQISYRSRAKTSRYEPKNVFAGSPAETAWPHGDAGAATIAPGKVLSSAAFSTLALTK